MERIKLAARLVLVTLVSGALAFGSVRAMDSGRAECPAEPPTFPGASCQHDWQCEGPCKQADENAWLWICDLPEGCCACAVR